MKDLISALTMFTKEINAYGITEIFIMDGELYTTSYYELPIELIEQIEKEAKAL